MDDDKEQHIREHAHRIWEVEGCPDGRAQIHWERAQREIEAGRSEETPQQSAHQSTEKVSLTQTDEPWKGLPEKEQFDTERSKPDLEQWNNSQTH